MNKIRTVKSIQKLHLMQESRRIGFPYKHLPKNKWW